MDVVVLHRQVPDVVEELVITEDGKGLDEDQVRYISNEMDEHALEQALLIKERYGGRVTVVAIGGTETRDALAAAKARGADEVLSVAVERRGHGDNHELAALLADIAKAWSFELLLTGVQTVEDMDGNVGGILAAYLGLPYVGGIAGVDVDPAQGVALVKKEYPGGLLAVMEVKLPAVLGIQAAERPLPYVPVSRIMQTKKSLVVKEIASTPLEVKGVSLVALSKPPPTGRAKLLEGDAESVAEAIVRLLMERGSL